MSKNQPIIIIGAPRSGTNMLKDVLSSFPELATFPCEEINPIWRHGNTDHPSDEFTPDMATDYVKKYIRSRFERLRKNTGARRIVEKSCANSLRVGFVNEVFPEAKFVHIVRDGVDVCASAQKKRIFNPFDIPFHWAKVKHVPLKDLPNYIFKFVIPRLVEVATSGGRMVSWGPSTSDVPEGGTDEQNLLLCAHQWSECVSKSVEAFEKMDSDRFIRIHYEDLVADPHKIFAKVLSFLGEEVPNNLDHYVDAVQSTSIGKGRRKMVDQHIDAIKPWVSDAMERLGYQI